MPDQQYRSGSWGFTGGRVFKLPNNGRLPYGTDKNIKGTDTDPVYQTQRAGITGYRLDVAAGEYELTLHFAELLGGTVNGLAYNLNDTERKEDTAQRVFNVYVNDKPVLENFNIAAQYGIAAAVEKKMKITVNDTRGLRIVFEAIKGEPVLNALQLRRIY